MDIKNHVIILAAFVLLLALPCQARIITVDDDLPADFNNIQAGIITDDRKIIAAIAEQFDKIFRGEHCSPCKRKQYCADYKDILLQ